MTVKYINVEKLNKINRFVNEVIDKVNNHNENPNRVIYKIAERENLNLETIKLLCRAYNISNTLSNYIQNEEVVGPKRAEFVVADYEKVMKLLYKPSEDEELISKTSEDEMRICFKLKERENEEAREKREKTAEYRFNELYEKLNPDLPSLVNKYDKNNRLYNLKLKYNELMNAERKFELESTRICDEICNSINKLSSYFRSNNSHINQVVNECVYRFKNTDELILLIKKATKNINKSAQFYNKDLYFDSEKEPWKTLGDLDNLISSFNKSVDLNKRINNLKSKLNDEIKKEVGKNYNFNEHDVVVGKYENMFLENLNLKKKFNLNEVNSNTNLINNLNDIAINKEKKLGEKEIYFEHIGGKGEKSKKEKFKDFESNIIKIHKNDGRRVMDNFVDRIVTNVDVFQKQLTLKRYLDSWILNDPVLSKFSPLIVYRMAGDVLEMFPSVGKSPMIFKTVLTEYIVNEGRLSPQSLRDLSLAIERITGEKGKGIDRKIDRSREIGEMFGQIENV